MTESAPLHSDAVNDALLVLIPQFNDWPALDKLLWSLDDVLHAIVREAGVLIVDDGSTDRPGDLVGRGPFRAFRHVDVLELRRNLGHQRAIAVGLAFVEDRGTCGTVVLMDSDGEDDPAELPKLLDRFSQEGGTKIVFAERAKRSESFVFRVFYWLFRGMHHLLVGHSVRTGNYSVVPRCRLSSLVVVAELWNHYAAAVIKSRQPCCTVPTRRAKRLHGMSRMNFVNLVIHGLNAISVYSETVGVRLLVVSLIMIAGAMAGSLVVLYVRVATPMAIPGWATYTMGILLILLSQGLMLSFVFSVVIMASRSWLTFLPRRDYSYFVGRIYSTSDPRE
jgi:polyisoprenyl-phosphate glycosyltransferase